MAFVQWIETYAQIIAFFVQVAWWLCTGIVAIWAAWNFQRYVETRMGTLKAEGGVGMSEGAVKDQASEKAADADRDKAKPSDKVDVDKFVE